MTEPLRTFEASADSAAAAAAGQLACALLLHSPRSSRSIECLITISSFSTAVIAAVSEHQLEDGREEEEEEKGDERAKSHSGDAAAAAAHGGGCVEGRRWAEKCSSVVDCAE